MILQHFQVKTENGILLIEIHSSILVICVTKNRVNTFKLKKWKNVTKIIFVWFYFTLFVLWKLFMILKFSKPTWMYPWIWIKVRLSPSKNCAIFLIESPLKTMKNAFCFVLKALFVLKIFKFLSRHFGHVWKMVWLKRWG